MTRKKMAMAGTIPPNPDHIQAVQDIVETKCQDRFVKRRDTQNVASHPRFFSPDEFWKWMVFCICTSVQKSGPNSRVSLFFREEPFPLRLSVCVGNLKLRRFAEEILRGRGLRFGKKLARQVESNIGWLNCGGWTTVEAHFNQLASFFGTNVLPQHRMDAERQAVRVVMGWNGGLAGFGPKQARKFWQGLGVTQYEIPLDSRVCNWLNALPSGFGIEVPKLYSNVRYYETKMTEIQAVCFAAGVLPCEFDAAVFSNADDEP